MTNDDSKQALPTSEEWAVERKIPLADRVLNSLRSLLKRGRRR